MSTQKDCKVAIIGAGYMAREHIRAFQDIPEVRILGLTSRTRARAESLAAEYGIPTVCDSIPELYEKTKADLVVVTVPELEANAVSKSCFQFPWTMLMEKPVGYNLADAELIEKAAKARQSRVYVALNRRFYSSTRSVVTDLAGLDDRRFIHILDQEDAIRALEAGQPKLVVDNWMYANSIHLIDYFTFLGRGEIKAVKPIVPWNPNEPWVVIAQIQYASGDVGLYEGIWNAPGPWSVSVNLSKKRWEMRPVETASVQNAGQRKIEPVEIHPWDSQFKPGLRLQAQEAVAATLGKKTDLPTLQDSLKSMKLVQAIYGA